MEGIRLTLPVSIDYVKTLKQSGFPVLIFGRILVTRKSLVTQSGEKEPIAKSR